jgi:hypothetical protein
MRNKRRVIVTIHHRDELSLGHHRERLGHEAFHWGILIAPKKSRGSDCNAYDVSDGVTPDPESRQDLNPERDWLFRSKEQVDPTRSGRLIGRVLIGKVPNRITDAEIKNILAAVPLPVKNAAPAQSCVTWVLAAIRALQDAGIARQFDVNQFIAWALTYADYCLANLQPGNFYDYLTGSS